MKLKNKIAITMALLGIGICLLISVFYYFWSRQILIKEELNRIIKVSESISQEINTHFREVTYTVKTLSSAPVVTEALLQSNADYAALSDNEREEWIASLSEKWTKTNDLEDPFIQEYLNNPIADYLKLQKVLIPERYGEIFITNRYGVIIGSTNKLTTINHAHKYWWLAGYNEGKGRIFLDDRGFDVSAEGYVIGIVMPIKYENEIIGIIKANVNILDVLNHIMENFEQLYETSKLQVARTGGLIVLQRNVAPLSTSVFDQLLENLQKKETFSLRIEVDGEKELVGVSEVPITAGSETIGFGGSYESIDHIKGNTGESWHAIAYLDEKIITSNIKNTIQLLLIIWIMFVLSISIVAMYFGNKIVKPIVALARFSKEVGKGKLDNRIILKSTDEIGQLANSYNLMVENLQNTMASKAELLVEVDKRKKIEEVLKQISVTDELTGIYNRRAANEFLQQYIEKARRYDEKLSVLILDIDHFKEVNDTYGHDLGDKTLISLANILKKNIRNVDKVARIGGEEFIILMPQIDKEEAFILAERLRIKIVMNEFEKIKQLTVSIGLSEYEFEDTYDSLFKRADDALYDSKGSGRNKVTMR